MNIEKQIKNGDFSSLNSGSKRFLSINSRIIRLAIEKGYRIDQQTARVIKNNAKYIRIFIEQGQVNAIEYALKNALSEENIRLAMENGYSFNWRTPEIIKSNPDYIKMIIEHGEPFYIHEAINLASSEALTDENIRLAIEKGYRIDRGTPINIKNNADYIKVFIEKGQIDAIEFAQGSALTEDIIRLAIEKGYIIHNNTPITITNNADYIKLFIEKGQIDAIEFAQGSALTEDIIRLAIEKYSDSFYKFPNSIKSNPNYVRYAIEIGSLNAIEHAKGDALSEENIRRSMEKGFRISSRSSIAILSNPKYMKMFIEHGQLDAIEYAKGNALTEENIKLAMRMGYRINERTPYDILINPKCIRLFIEFGQVDAIEYAQGNALTEENILLALKNGRPDYIEYFPKDTVLSEESIRLALQKGYVISGSTPNHIRDSVKRFITHNVDFVKTIVKNGQPSIIDNLDSYGLTDDIIRTAIESGYVIHSKTSNSIRFNLEYLKMFIEHGQPNAMDFYDGYRLSDDIIKLAIEKGYEIKRGETSVNEKINIYIRRDVQCIKNLMKSGQLNNEAFAECISIDSMRSMMNIICDDLELLEIFVKNLEKQTVFSSQTISQTMFVLSVLNKLDNKTANTLSLCSDLTKRVRESLIERFSDVELVDAYLEFVLKNKRDPFLYVNITNINDMKYAINYSDLKSHNHQSTSNITDEVFEKANKEHITEIITMLRAKRVSEFSIPLLAVNIYLSIGHDKAVQLLSGKYGEISEEKLLSVFRNVDPSFTLFEKDASGENFEPQLNQPLLNTMFGEDYMVSNTPIKNLLGDCADKIREINQRKAIIKDDSSLTDEEKYRLLYELDMQLARYQEELPMFFETAFMPNQDIVEEETATRGM